MKNIIEYMSGLPMLICAGIMAFLLGLGVGTGNMAIIKTEIILGISYIAVLYGLKGVNSLKKEEK